MGIVRVDLGTRGFGLGSTGQARELLALVESKPGDDKYQILYQDETDTIVFGAHLDIDVLTRVRLRPDGSGVAENWISHVLERLEAAALGGSLNDTPAGKMPGSFAPFKPGPEQTAD